MRYLTVEEILLIHEYELERYGGKPGILSLELLESAAHRPGTSYSGRELYETPFKKAASLIHSLIKNHPFVDGNKRTAMVSGTVFLSLNGYFLNLTQKVYRETALAIAAGDMTIHKLSRLLETSATHERG